MDQDTAEVEVVSQDRLEAITRTEIDVSIATAHKFPRSIKLFKETAMDMATLDKATAESCFYTLPRAGKTIQGPSVRLAEIIASAWGNMRAGARIIAQDKRFITAQAIAHDLERNVQITIEVQRRITNKEGKTYNDDMIVMTGNAACSIALRNAVFKVVPGAYTKEIYLAVIATAAGNRLTLGQDRDRWVQWFVDQGADEASLFSVLGVNGIEDVGVEELQVMIGLSNAIQDGDSTIEDVFEKHEQDRGTGSFKSQNGDDDAASKKDKATPAVEKKFSKLVATIGSKKVGEYLAAHNLPGLGKVDVKWMKDTVANGDAFAADVNEWCDKQGGE